jgi:hypothetical protein
MSEKVKCQVCSKLFKDSQSLSAHREKDHPKRQADTDLAELAKDRMYEFLQGDGMDKGLREIASKAAVVLSAEAKSEQSKNNSVTVTLAAAQRLSETPEQFRKIIANALPNHPVTKAALSVMEMPQLSK